MNNLNIKDLDHLGIVAGIIDEMGLVEIIDEEVAAIPNSECSQRYKRLDVFTGKGFAMKIAN
jgi:hypothetical protein